MKIVCAKCKAEGFSKCPRCRNVFMDDQDLVILQMVMTAQKGSYDVAWRKDDGKDLVVTLTLREEETIQQAIVRLKSILHEQRDVVLQQLCCDHHWLHTTECPFCGAKDETQGDLPGRTTPTT